MPDVNLIEGVDISHHNGDINLQSIANAGRKFCIIKCVDGAFNNDTRFQQNWQKAKAAKLIPGAYLFMRALHDPVKQADNLINNLAEPFGPGQLPPVLDVEWDKNRPNDPDKWQFITDPVKRAKVVATCAQQVKQRIGILPMIYTSRSFWNPTFGGNTSFMDVDFGECPLWVVDYNPQRVNPLIPTPWKTTGWKIRQYSGSGNVAGIQPLDLDRFNGALADLLKLAGQ